MLTLGCKSDLPICWEQELRSCYQSPDHISLDCCSARLITTQSLSGEHRLKPSNICWELSGFNNNRVSSKCTDDVWWRFLHWHKFECRNSQVKDLKEWSWNFLRHVWARFRPSLSFVMTNARCAPVWNCDHNRDNKFYKHFSSPRTRPLTRASFYNKSPAKDVGALFRCGDILPKVTRRSQIGGVSYATSSGRPPLMLACPGLAIIWILIRSLLGKLNCLAN